MSRRKLLVGTGLLASSSSGAHIDIPFNSFSDNSSNVGGSDYSDTLMRWKYLFIFCNSMLGVFLMLLELQVAWNGSELVWTRATRTLRFLISFLTVLLLVQLLDYYNGLLATMTKVWKHSRANTGFNISVWSVLRASPLARTFWAEVLVCSLHAPPFQPIGDKWGLLMLLRFYMVFMIIRDRSTIYLRRNTIMQKYTKYGIRHWAPPKFNWFMSVKSLFLRRPFPFMLSITLWTIWACGHCIYIFERENNPAQFNYIGSLYLSMISMITGWPTDTYEEFWPHTRMGRTACIMSTLIGLFELAMLLEVFSSWFVATPHQRPALVWAHRQDIKQQLRDAAARIIQLVWRKHILSSVSNSRMHILSRRAARCVGGGSLGTRYVAAVKVFRNLMRQKVSLHINFAESQSVSNLADSQSVFTEPQDLKFTQPRAESSHDNNSKTRHNNGEARNVHFAERHTSSNSFGIHEAADVEDRIRSMEVLIQNLTRKIDLLVSSSTNSV